ncbi:hypothetical protein GDO81_013440 [Engystomops pustulosus]|uniref:Uncharacterized protein n=1 Tax=Engystomops pustulosus TaxID=76066 RepID=A0AAV7B0G4_ENGPU|nr:hypothetical protein GDO81_013440 [Engystomops pustulosus]
MLSCVHGSSSTVQERNAAYLCVTVYSRCMTDISNAHRCAGWGKIWNISRVINAVELLIIFSRHRSPGFVHWIVPGETLNSFTGSLNTAGVSRVQLLSQIKFQLSSYLPLPL